MEGANVVITHRGGTQKSVIVLGFSHSSRPLVNVRFTMAGCYTVNLNHGWLEKPCDDWRIADPDLEKLRAWANEKQHFVSVVPRSTGRPVEPKKGPRPHPKQQRFEGGSR